MWDCRLITYWLAPDECINSHAAIDSLQSELLREHRVPDVPQSV